MAKVIESKKGFKLIECSNTELIKVGGIGICDYCNTANTTGVYIAVLNAWYCTKCFEAWHKRAKNHVSDHFIEKQNFDFYKSAFDLYKKTSIEKIMYVRHIIKLFEENLACIVANEKKYNGKGYVLATYDLNYCIVGIGKGIKGTNVATHLVDPHVFDRRIVASNYKDSIKASNPQWEIVFSVWKVSAYFTAIKEQYTQLLDIAKESDNKTGNITI